jgi:hypothetical protein
MCYALAVPMPTCEAHVYACMPSRERMRHKLDLHQFQIKEIFT